MASLRKAQTDSNRTMAILTLAMTFLVIAFVSALTTGKYPISLADLCAGEPMAVRTFTILRLPRALMGLVGGFGLGVAGFVYQTVFRNPLASPDIIGVSSGASAGAAFAILFTSAASPSTTPIPIWRLSWRTWRSSASRCGRACCRRTISPPYSGS